MGGEARLGGLLALALGCQLAAADDRLTAPTVEVKAFDTRLGRADSTTWRGRAWVWSDNKHLLITHAEVNDITQPHGVMSFDLVTGRVTQALESARLYCMDDAGPRVLIQRDPPISRMQLFQWLPETSSLALDAAATSAWNQRPCNVHEWREPAMYRSAALADVQDKQIGLLAPAHGFIAFDVPPYEGKPTPLYWYPPDKAIQALPADSSDLPYRPGGPIFRVKFVDYLKAYYMTPGGHAGEHPKDAKAVTLMSPNGQVTRHKLPEQLAKLVNGTNAWINTLPVRDGWLHFLQGPDKYAGEIYWERKDLRRLSLRYASGQRPWSGEVFPEFDSVSPDGCAVAFQAPPLDESQGKPKLYSIHVIQLCG